MSGTMFLIILKASRDNSAGTSNEFSRDGSWNIWGHGMELAVCRGDTFMYSETFSYGRFTWRGKDDGVRSYV